VGGRGLNGFPAIRELKEMKGPTNLLVKVQQERKLVVRQLPG
jgi:hypothetical protein